jgi:hypothetical protein
MVMEAWVKIVLGVILVVLIIDLFIIGGPDPRKWKGGDKK